MGRQRVSALIAATALALVVLGCAGEEQGPEGNALAVINGRPLTAADVDARIGSMAPEVAKEFNTPNMLSSLIDREVKVRVLAEAARDAGIDESDEYKKLLANAEESILAELYTRRSKAEAAEISEEELREAYERDKHLYSKGSAVRARHILCKTEEDALKALESIRGGMPFDEAVKVYSVDALTKAQGGELGRLTRESAVPGLGVDPEFVDALAAIEPGSVGGPIRSRIGYHVVEVTKRTEGPSRPFSEVRGQIARRLAKERSELGTTEDLRRLWEKYNVTINERAIKKYIGYPITPDEFIRALQEATATGDKIALCKDMVSQFPDNKYAPYAQFMLGFVFSEELHNYAEAEAAFAVLLERYPDSRFAGAARWMIDNMRGDHAPLRNVEDVVERAKQAGD